MRIIVDTNVVISGVFFNGNPRKVLRAVIHSEVEAFASLDIVDEYNETLAEVAARHDSKLAPMLNREVFFGFIGRLAIEEPTRHVSVCRDPDDDKFLDCALESHALYIVSGDKDLLSVGEFEGVEIITAADFCDRYLGGIPGQ